MEHLDVLRGFALLGILLVNFQFFTRPLQAIVLGSDTDLAGLDQFADQFVRIIAEGKFYPLFSMLFGAGFALMLERARDREAPFWGIYLRRLIVLFLFGLAHMLLVWSGDILLVYSLSAFVMILLFRNTPMRRLWLRVKIATCCCCCAFNGVFLRIVPPDDRDVGNDFRHIRGSH